MRYSSRYSNGDNSIREVANYDSSCANNSFGANAYAVDDRGAHSKPRHLADLRRAPHSRVRRQMRVVSNLAVMFDYSGGIENNAIADYRIGIHHNTGHHDCAIADSSGRRDDRSLVNQFNQWNTNFRAAFRDRATCRIIANPQRYCDFGVL